MRALLCLLLRLLLCAGALAAGPARAAFSADTSGATTALYPWLDPSGGSSVSVNQGSVSAAVPLPFSFSFGSSAYSSVKVGANGTLQFGAATSGAATHAALPLDGSAGKPNIDAVMLPLWDDFSPSAGQVSWKTQGSAPNRVFTVTWNAVPYTGGTVSTTTTFCNPILFFICLFPWQYSTTTTTTTYTATFQVQLHEAGHFVYRYASVDGSGGGHTGGASFTNYSGATVGYEAGNADYSQFSRNSAAVPGGSAIVWQPVNLLAHYAMDEAAWNGSPGEVLDSSGNGQHASAAGLAGHRPATANAYPALTDSPGTCSYGVFSRSSKDYLALPGSLGAMANASFTVTAWIRSLDPTQPGQRILVQDELGYGPWVAGAVGWGLSLGDGGTGSVRLYSRSTDSASALQTANVVQANRWYFVAARVNTTLRTKNLMVYDQAGALLANVSVGYTTPVFNNNGGNLNGSVGGETNNAAGGENNANYGFNGNLDELRVYQGVLSDVDLTGVRTTRHTCPPLPVAHYRMDESNWTGALGEVLDSSGNGLHGDAQFVANVGGSCSPWGVFNGNTASPQRVRVPYNSALNSAGSFSVMLWVYANGSSASFRSPLTQRRTVASPFSGWTFYLDPANGWRFWLADQAQLGAVDAGFNSSTVSAWVHLAATFSATSGPDGLGRYQGTLNLYRDGVLANTVAGAYYKPNDSEALYIGSGGDSPGLRDPLGFSLYPFTGRVDEVKLFSQALSAAEVAAAMARSLPCGAPARLLLEHASGSALSCAPTTLTVRACADAACATPYPDALSGTLSASGTTVNWPAGAAFSMAAGSGSTTVSVHATTAGNLLLGAVSTPAATGGTTCNFGSPSCTLGVADSGLLFSVPSHAADSVQNISVAAVKKADNSLACAPAFASVSKALSFQCSHVNPSSGSRPVRVGGVALNSGNNTAAACDLGGRSVTLAFDASGTASTTLQYADVGRMSLNASYSGSGSDAGLVLNGSASFVAAPASFDFSGLSPGPLKAGNAFAATVNARNSSGALTPNFGRETPAEGVNLAFTRRAPTGSGAQDGVFSGSTGAFSNGSAAATNLSWSEVGRGDLSATLASGSYLGSGLSASGSTGTGGAVGPFTPHRFNASVTAQGCGSFSYAGQPFSVRITALNASGGITRNYDGSTATSPNFARSSTLAEKVVSGLGSFSGHVLAASRFTAGEATASPSFGFTSKLSGPLTLLLRATDSDGISSAGGVEDSVPLRSGRLRLVNGFGSESQPLQLRVLADYWGGSGWLPNSADNCSALAASALALSNQRNHLGSATSAWTTSGSAVALSGGQGLLTLSAPGKGKTGTVDLALNLGSSSADTSCLASHPASTGAGLAWLRSQQGGCASTWDRDPSARASFGIYSPETRKTVHVRDIF